MLDQRPAKWIFPNVNCPITHPLRQPLIIKYPGSSRLPCYGRGPPQSQICTSFYFMTPFLFYVPFVYNFFSVCMHTYANHNASVRGQLLGVESLLPLHGPRDWTRVLRIGSMNLYLLSHLAGPHPPFWLSLAFSKPSNATVRRSHLPLSQKSLTGTGWWWHTDTHL